MDVTAAAKAGFWVRFGAILIDGIILAIVGAIVQRILGTGAGGGLSTLISIAYYVYFWTTSGQTPGHQALHLRVVRTDGTSLDVVTAIIRYVGYIISAIPIFLGFLWVAWDPQKQGWHDKLASTYVIRTS